MSLKRAYCKKCKTKNEMLRIFDVNSEASVCYCPHCMAEQSPDDVIENYNKYIQNKIDNAFRMLFIKTEFDIAYQMFAHVLEIDPNAIEARIGRLLSLVYLSKVRRARFKDAMLIIKEESVLYFRKAKNFPQYIKFLKKVNDASNEYQENFKKRLSVKTYYYDDECIKLMFKRTNEILEFKKFLLSEVEFLQHKHDVEEVTSLIETLNEEIQAATKELGSKVFAVDGIAYGLAGFGADGNAILGHSNKTETVRLRFFRRRTLGNSDKKVALIKDDVFKTSKHIWHFIRNAIPWETAFSTIAIVGLVLTFVGPTQLVRLISLITFGVMTLVVAILFIIQLCGRRKLRIRGHLIK